MLRRIDIMTRHKIPPTPIYFCGCGAQYEDEAALDIHKRGHDDLKLMVLRFDKVNEIFQVLLKDHSDLKLENRRLSEEIKRLTAVPVVKTLTRWGRFKLWIKYEAPVR